MSSPSVNKYDIISENALVIVDIVINCAFINFFSILAVLGNILSIIILMKQGLNDSTNITLLSLSVVDLAYGAILPVRRIRCVVSRFDHTMAQDFDVLANIYLAVPTRLLSFISSGHIVLISLERTVAVYFPIRASRIFSVQRTIICLSLIYLFWLTLLSPFFEMFSMLNLFNFESNKTVLILTFSNYFVANLEVFNFINVFVVANFRGPVSFVIISAASLAIGVRLRKARRNRREMTSSKCKTSFDAKAVKMMLTVCLVYLALAFPSMIPTLVYLIDETFVIYQGQTTAMYTVSEYVVDFLYVLNAAVNFVIYVTMSKKFSKTYVALMGRCLYWCAASKQT